MKIFKKPFKKTHFGGGSSSNSQDPGRSGDLPPPSPSSSAASPSCESDHRAAVADPPAATPEDGARPPADYFSSSEEFQMQLALALSAAAPPSAVPEDAARPAAAAAEERENYFLSEEEFQMQMALALSASNSEFRADPDRDQIRAATLLSLGRNRNDHGREENGAADALSRRYWDYNVLDYNEKVIDGFYDIFGFSSDSASQGKMPSLVDLQTGIGDLGFEVVIVNRAIDPQLVELEQITHCVSLDCPAAQVGILVQRISELVMEHMGGPVRDANDMLARWMENSLGLRTSLQTSLLPIGCIKVGLSRHRALLFKVLADNVGIPCRLVKGSHYTGVDDDAVNIIKLDDERPLIYIILEEQGNTRVSCSRAREKIEENKKKERDGLQRRVGLLLLGAVGFYLGGLYICLV